ncbi:MAG TPA: GTPase HflX [Rubrobacteraceae bacterium]|nr:GTPase HflX [Rubrobacteraceae bacterium]
MTADMEKSGDRAVLVGAGESRHLAELGRLATTLGLEVAGVLEQNRRDGTGYLGRGKREELRELVVEVGANFVVADDELTASQSRVLERSVGISGVTVVDRTELIIRIFEAHARDAASRLEVELADLEYRLPRVKGRNPELSRLGGGGVTTRGPGEQQLEYDRRVIRRRIETINRRLENERAARAVRGARLRESGPPTVALVGYTNAGKTTVLNALSGAGRSTRDRLFETLDTTTRLVEGRNDSRPENDHDGDGHGSASPDFVVTDTVGFIRKLPTQLVYSFASTLEAARDADVRVLCADASSEDLYEEVRTVRETLAEALGSGDGDLGPTILCLNKVDLISRERESRLRREYPEAVMTSAAHGEDGCEALLEEIYRTISSERERLEVLIPHSDYAAAARLYGLAEIHAQESTHEGVWMDVSLPKNTSAKYAAYKTR